MLISTLDLAWLAGILEGEGYIGTKEGCDSPAIALKMSDVDIVSRAGGLMGVYTIGRVEPINPNHKVQYRITVNGVRAAGVLMTLYQFFGKRRKEQCIRILDAWKAHVYGVRTVKVIL